MRLLEKRNRNLSYDKLKSVGILNYSKKSLNLSYMKSSELVERNDYYGISYWLKKYAGLDVLTPFNISVYHGMLLCKEWIDAFEIRRHVERILFISQNDAEVLKTCSHKKPLVVGPYIAYAENFYSIDEQKKLQMKYGKVLLVIPSHSTVYADSNYDIMKFVLEIKKVQSDYDTVMVCLHYRDIQRGIDKIYKKQGYIVVCAGHMFDNLFLCRMRSILNLADTVLLNDVGTALGYALYFGKKCKIAYQEPIHVIHGLSPMFLGGYSDAYYEIIQRFSREPIGVTDDNREFCNWMFGLNQVKSSKELNHLLTPYLKKQG